MHKFILLSIFLDMTYGPPVLESGQHSPRHKCHSKILNDSHGGERHFDERTKASTLELLFLRDCDQHANATKGHKNERYLIRHHKIESSEVREP